MYKSIKKPEIGDHLILGRLWSRSRGTKQPDEMRLSHIIWVAYKLGWFTNKITEMIHERYDSDILPEEFSKSVLKGLPNDMNLISLMSQIKLIIKSLMDFISLQHYIGNRRTTCLCSRHKTQAIFMIRMLSKQTVEVQEVFSQWIYLICTAI